MLKLASVILAAAVGTMSAPALAATQMQCADQFKAADLNNDGVLSGSEIGNAKPTIPASLANKPSITRQEFLAACTKGS
jgi:hypothetical protein